ncbi:MAG: SDR family NAD(P)-dependent oxidoreductase [Acidobacteriaceae bacterium]|nr:SDR family NAD(P)-dependent oxidoreductase [Acidobacteriaceae bacterium]
MPDLRNKHALVTGAASGIGFAIAKLFSEAGASVTFLDLDAEKASGAAAGFANARGLGCDVASESSVAAAFAAHNAPLDILVNCAGIAHVGNLEGTEAADMERLFRVNVLGSFLCMKASLPLMRRAGGGVILNLASIAATRGISDRFAYSMTKGAVLAMTLSAAKDYLGENIRVNCISPARIHTPFVDGFVTRNYPGREAEKMKELAASQPIGRMGTPQEVAELALFLCSDLGSFLTGADYPLDGGFFNLR